MADNEDEWLTTREAAKLLGRPVGTLIDWRGRSLGPTYYKYGKVRYLRSDVMAFRMSIRAEKAAA